MYPSLVRILRILHLGLLRISFSIFFGSDVIVSKAIVSSDPLKADCELAYRLRKRATPTAVAPGLLSLLQAGGFDPWLCFKYPPGIWGARRT
jgi:hypothetical protein